MASFDRREIVGLLQEHFSDLAGMASEEIHHFLNAVTGLEVAAEETNGTAFDAWRQSLAVAGYQGVWGLTPLQVAQVQERVAPQAAAAAPFRIDQQERLAVELDRLSKIGVTAEPLVAVPDEAPPVISEPAVVSPAVSVEPDAVDTKIPEVDAGVDVK